MPVVKILFISANPRDKKFLNSKPEYTQINDKIQKEAYRDSMKLIPEWDVKPDNLIDLIQQHKPDVVHFSVHGDKDNIYLIGDNGQTELMEWETLIGILENFKEKIKLIILNACFTASTASVLANKMGCAIGMDGDISDTAAIKFASAFYNMSAAGNSIQRSYNMGLLKLRSGNLKKYADMIKLEPGQNIDPDKIHLIPKQSREEWLRSHPELLNNFFTILEFTRTIQHIFLMVSIQHLNEFSIKLSEIQKSDDPLKVNSFNMSWDIYIKKYRDYKRILSSKIKEDGYKIQTAFDKIKSITGVTFPSIEKKLCRINKDFREISNQYYEYNRTHDSTANSLNSNTSNIISVLKDRQFYSQISKLSLHANSLITNADNLMKKLIELSLQKRRTI